MTASARAAKVSLVGGAYFALGTLLLACACGGGPSAVTPREPGAAPAARVEPWPPADAASGVDDATLASLFERYWAAELELDPEWATELGVHRFDDRLEDNSREGVERERATRRAFLDEARALAARTDLRHDERTSLELLVGALEADLATAVCALEEWSLSAASNPLTRWNRLPESHPVSSPESGAALAARYAQVARHVDREIEQLRRGLARGLVSNAESARRVADMFEGQLAEPLERWPLLSPLQAEHAGWPAAARDAYRRALREAVASQIEPAFERYLALLEEEVLPRARGEEASGLVHLPNGAECYRALVFEHTTTRHDPHQIHATGLRLIQQLDADITELARQAIGSTSLADALRRLREDRALYFDSAEEIEEKARASLERARAAVPRVFGVLPAASCVVTRIPEYEAPYAWTAYYRPAVPDGSRPGEYYVNVYRPETRPRFEASVLAFHESIPGHHLQISIAQELRGVPAFRKHARPNAFIEGWALYTERLADELGLYETALDRIGMLSFDAWRAARLVVDTGIHTLGWSRKQAADFMLAHTALSPANIDNEVDRYIVWPGQALAYKLGQLEILALRDLARQRLGQRFDLRTFHDAVLLGGGVSLPALRRQVMAYIERAGARTP